MFLPFFSLLDWMLLKLAEDTWENLREAKNLSIRFGEETITDLLMLKLRRRGFWAFKQTPLAEEPIKGTDFECWIGWPGISWTGFAVQAKKLIRHKDTRKIDSYDSLPHKVGNARTPQVDILKAYAARRRISPRYCLYNYSELVDPSFLNCCCRCYPKEELGCTITTIETVEWALERGHSKRRTFDALHRRKDTVPWRCLATCPRVRLSLLNGSPSLAFDSSPLIAGDTDFHPQLPDGLNRLMQQEEQTVDFREFGIGANLRQTDLRGQVPDGLIIPNRVFILDLSNTGTQQQPFPA